MENQQIRRRTVIASVGGVLAGGYGVRGAAATSATSPQSVTDGARVRTPAAAAAFPGGESIDDFSAFGDDWSVEGGTATLDETGYGGRPAVRQSSAGDPRARITLSFDEPRNYSDRDVSIAAQLHSTTKAIFELLVTLVDGHGDELRRSGSIQPTATDRWVRLDAGVRQDDGADLSAIEELRVEHWVGSDDESTFSVADLRRHPAPDYGYVMFTFDDGPPEDYSVAYDVLSEYGMRGAAYPPTDKIGTRGPSLDEYREMVADGWDVGGHTQNHASLPNHSREEQRRILAENREYLDDHGLTPGVFRTPYSSYDHHTLDLMDELFDLSIVGSGAAAGTNYEISDPTTVGFNPGDDSEQAKEFIDAAVEYDQLLGLTFHMARLSSRSAFESVVEHAHRYVERGDLKVITPSELYDRRVGRRTPEPVVGSAPPTDPDGDGRYEDVNGNGRTDFDDVVALFENRRSDAVTDHADAYDFNENDRIDFDDIVALFEELTS
jgi:peptidoglycan/xylan/chitin deacetylase (PgdA/CDA1 family)